MTTERFSTADVDRPDRVAYWTRIGSETYCELTVEPRGDAEFGGALMRRAYGDVWLTQVTTTPAMVRGEAREASRRDPEHACVLLTDSGTCEHVADGRRAWLAPGTLSLHLTSRLYSIAFDEVTRFIILKVPAARLAARTGNLRRLAGLRIEARDTVFLAGFLRTLIARDDAANEPGWHDAISDVIFDLMAITYRRAPAAIVPRSTVQDRWQELVRDFVDHHLHEPELGAPLIAQRLGVTPRYVQMVFAGMATTASAYIVGRRLEFAAQLLVNGRAAVTDVAFRAGFADLSHFYRSFRRRYGVSPKRYAAER